METQTLKTTGGKLKEINKQRINPFLWFDSDAEAAAHFYTSTFKNSRIITTTHYGAEGAKVSGREKGSVMTVAFEIEGEEFVGINGGPIFQITPAVSFFVHCDTKEEINTLWAKLSENGTVMMELGKYHFSDWYGWIQDKFGVSWQLILDSREQKIAPCLMFTGSQHRKAEEAINYYMSIFKNSALVQLEKYQAGIGPEGAVVHSKFILDGLLITAMDSHIPLPHEFTPAISFVVNCKNQDEIDYYWEKLSAGGDESAQQCGWLLDKFGFSWQVTPADLDEIMHSTEPGKAEKAMKAILKMKKIDIKTVLEEIEKP